MIDGELVGRELLSAILAGIVVALEKIPPAERHTGIGYPIELPQSDDFGNFETE